MKLQGAKIQFLAVSILLLCLAGCKNEVALQGMSLSKPKFSVYLGNESNNPTLNSSTLEKSKRNSDYKSVIVNVSHFEVLLSGHGKGARVIINENFGELDLMSLSRGLPLPISKFGVPSGVSVHQIRIVLFEDGNYVTLADNSVHNLTTPSAQHSGLKVILKNPLLMTSNNTYSLLIDFNPDKNIIQAATTKYSLKPVLKLSKALVIPNDTDEDIDDFLDEGGFDEVGSLPNVDDVVDTIDSPESDDSEDSSTDVDVNPPADSTESTFGEGFDPMDPSTWPEGITIKDIDAYFGDDGF